HRADPETLAGLGTLSVRESAGTASPRDQAVLNGLRDLHHATRPGAKLPVVGAHEPFHDGPLPQISPHQPAQQSVSGSMPLASRGAPWPAEFLAPVSPFAAALAADLSAPASAPPLRSFEAISQAPLDPHRELTRLLALIDRARNPTNPAWSSTMGTSY